MMQEIQNELGRLNVLTVKQLQAHYTETFGEETHSCNRDFLIKRIAWRLQANREGGLSERALRRASELADPTDLRIRAPKGAFPARVQEVVVPHACALPRDKRLPPPHTVITRQYKGRRIEVTVLESGFLYDGKHYPTLSAIAKMVTGTQWNGYTFFRI
mgnify:FL=1